MQRGILDSLDSRIAVLDGRGVILAVNRAWEEFDHRPDRAGQTSATVGDDYFEALRDAAARATSSP
jgi:PAS domain-containing protein